MLNRFALGESGCIYSNHPSIHAQPTQFYNHFTVHRRICMLPSILPVIWICINEYLFLHCQMCISMRILDYVLPLPTKRYIRMISGVYYWNMRRFTVDFWAYAKSVRMILLNLDEIKLKKRELEISFYAANQYMAYQIDFYILPFF